MCGKMKTLMILCIIIFELLTFPPANPYWAKAPERAKIMNFNQKDEIMKIIPKYKFVRDRNGGH